MTTTGPNSTGRSGQEPPGSELRHPEYLVDTDWLAEHLDDPSVRIVDVTTKLTAEFVNKAKADIYDTGHIPGAVFIDVGSRNGEFHDPDADLPWTWAAPERFAALMGRYGISNDTHVVLVAATPRLGIDSGTMWCTRAWWTMHHFGVRCSILRGGMERWRAQGRPLSTEEPSVTPTTFTVADGWQRGRADRQDVLDALASDGACVLDSLPESSFAGQDGRYGPRQGHITGAKNLPFRQLVEAETAAFHDADTLHAELDARGLFDQDTVVTYCGGAIAATATAFALALFGHEGVSVYDGSLMEWSSDETLPMTDPSAA